MDDDADLPDQRGVVQLTTGDIILTTRRLYPTSHQATAAALKLWNDGDLDA